MSFFDNFSKIMNPMGAVGGGGGSPFDFGGMLGGGSSPVPGFDAFGGMGGGGPLPSFPGMGGAGQGWTGIPPLGNAMNDPMSLIRPPFMNQNGGFQMPGSQTSVISNGQPSTTQQVGDGGGTPGQSLPAWMGGIHGDLLNLLNNPMDGFGPKGYKPMLDLNDYLSKTYDDVLGKIPGIYDAQAKAGTQKLMDTYGARRGQAAREMASMGILNSPAGYASINHGDDEQYRAISDLLNQLGGQQAQSQVGAAMDFAGKRGENQKFLGQMGLSASSLDQDRRKALADALLSKDLTEKKLAHDSDMSAYDRMAKALLQQNELNTQWKMATNKPSPESTLWNSFLGNTFNSFGSELGHNTAPPSFMDLMNGGTNAAGKAGSIFAMAG